MTSLLWYRLLDSVVKLCKIGLSQVHVSVGSWDKGDDDGYDYECYAVTPCGGVTQMQKLRALLVGAQGYHKFPLSKPVVGQNIALDAVPAYRASIPT